MHNHRSLVVTVAMAPMAVLGLSGCLAYAPAMDEAALREFGTRYAAAWSSRNAASLAALYAEGGSLKVNDGEPAVGREAVEGGTG